MKPVCDRSVYCKKCLILYVVPHGGKPEETCSDCGGPLGKYQWPRKGETVMLPAVPPDMEELYKEEEH